MNPAFNRPEEGRRFDSMIVRDGGAELGKKKSKKNKGREKTLKNKRRTLFTSAHQ